MIRCKLISPTNLLLEHPLLLAPHDEAEFWVVTKKGLKSELLDRFYLGAVSGFGAGLLLALLAYLTR